MSVASRRRARARRRARVRRRLARIAAYENIYPSQRITYKGRHIESKNTSIQLDVDVKNFVQPDNFAYNFAGVAGANNVKSFDHKAWYIQKAVCNYMEYVSDEENEGYTEFWQFPFETLGLRCGDCEDGAILMASAMIASGIPSNRVRVYAGWVKTGNPEQPLGGHAYVAYLRNYDTLVTPLDWCYLADPDTHIYNKTPLARNGNYGDVWFSFNNQKSWGERPLRFSSRQNLEEKFLGTS